ncbi:DUF2231 domain-containing protein [Streptomyces violaceusniger]|uniref:DUF2231 domain-containing protein n=1 Tax=Streptomyces violaceusniger (strain Tu 4113) TaxID=653045 RepID=G2PC10_STRV4|nr:DUF2231 domain-containing protein [Streptomyces violaceusniger]AEM81384.1 hypothetical protein Strvi_1645 [Streptomyces violaceusniger Tu 4113]
MSLTVVNGLPAHVLIVHFVVVLVPLSALAVVVGAIWPSAARRMGVALPLLALVTLACVPLATGAGEWLEKHVDSDALVRRHAELGDGLLPWAVALLVLAAVIWWTARRSAAAEAASGERTQAVASRYALLVRVAVAVLCVGVAAGAVVDVHRIGDSGAKAAWHDGFSKTAHGDRDHNG